MFDIVGYGKEVCWFVIIKDIDSYVFEELVDDGDEFVAVVEFGYDVLEFFFVDRVKGFG